MALHRSELAALDSSELLELFRVYRIPHHDGPLLNAIDAWLTPAQVEIAKIDPIVAIKKGVAFPATVANLMRVYDELFRDKIPFYIVNIRDFAEYPMRQAFGRDPWELLTAYIKEGDAVFRRVTKLDPALFLNNAERIFYLTRGYGRPNRHISKRDAQVRSELLCMSRTAIIALSDLLEMCPLRQDPDLILEKLSDLDLGTVDDYYLGTIHTISQSRDEKSFKQALRDMGISTLVRYEKGVYISNISQLGMYRNVDPRAVYDPEKVRDLPNMLVYDYLSTLSDDELMSIPKPRYQPKSLPFLRRAILNGAWYYLTQKRVIILGDQVYYGRFVDTPRSPMPLQQVLDHIARKDMLELPNGTFLRVQDADQLAAIDARVQKVVDKTKRMALQSTEPIDKVAFLKAMQPPYNIPEEYKSLTAFTQKEGEIFPIAMTLGEYFRYVHPSSPQILEATKMYYLQVLA